MVDDSLTLPPYHSPANQEYKAYFNQAKLFNQKLYTRVQNVFEAAFHDRSQRDFLINAVGSDARYEKGPVSPLELAVYTEDETEQKQVKNTLTFYADHLTTAKILDREIEWRNLDQVDPANMIINRPDKNTSFVSPNRIFDSRPLYGDRKLRTKALNNLAEQAREPKGAQKLKSLKRKLREYHQVTKSGTQTFKGKELRHFDSATGDVNYDGVHRWSFKMGPLRTLQFALARDKYRMTRDGADINQLGNISRNTVSQLDDLYHLAEPQIEKSTITELQDHYKFFLHGYHESQWEHRVNQNSSIQKDQDELERRARQFHHIMDFTQGENGPNYMFTYSGS